MVFLKIIAILVVLGLLYAWSWLADWACVAAVAVLLHQVIPLHLSIAWIDWILYGIAAFALVLALFQFRMVYRSFRFMMTALPGAVLYASLAPVFGEAVLSPKTESVIAFFVFLIIPRMFWQMSRQDTTEEYEYSKTNWLTDVTTHFYSEHHVDRTDLFHVAGMENAWMPFQIVVSTLVTSVTTFVLFLLLIENADVLHLNGLLVFIVACVFNGLLEYFVMNRRDAEIDEENKLLVD